MPLSERRRERSSIRSFASNMKRSVRPIPTSFSGRLVIRPACVADADELAPRLREADRLEILAADGRDPLIVLREGVERSSPCFAVMSPLDHLVALFGAAPDTRSMHYGMVWLLGSDELLRYPTQVLRLSRHWVDRLQKVYPVLGNRIDARNQVHLKWLLWCGFRIVRRIDC